MLIVLNNNLTTVEVITGVILDSYMPTAKWFVGQVPTICCISLILQLCFTPKTLITSSTTILLLSIADSNAALPEVSGHYQRNWCPQHLGMLLSFFS